jgi:hypothetical protein
MNSRFVRSILMATSLLPRGAAGVWAGDFIDLKLPPVAREYCHVIRFPRGWKAEHFDDPPAYPGIDYYSSDYEFRVEGLLGTWFLVGAFTPNIERRVNSTNQYRVNLSDPTAPVLPANKRDWNAAAVVPLVRKSISPRIVGYQRSFDRFHQYTMSGARSLIPGSESRLSPDSAWLVLQSATQAKTRVVDVFNVFFDMFNAATGKKLFTIRGTYSGIGDPEGSLDRTGWLTERYFIIPLGKHRERCVVCEFAPPREPGGKP